MAASNVVVAQDGYSAGAYSIAGTVVVWVVVSAEKECCMREHELGMTEDVFGSAVDRVLGTMRNVDIPGGSPALKVGLECMQDE